MTPAQWWAGLPTQQKVLVGAGGAAVAFLGYRWWRRRGASQQAAAQSQLQAAQAATGGQATEPVATVTTPSGASYSGPQSSLPGFYSSTPGQGGGGLATAVLPSGASYSGPAAGLDQFVGELQPAPPAPTSSTSPGYGTISIGGSNPGQYIILGPAGGQVYQVAGGAPVYFGNANQVDQGTGPEAAAGAAGGYAYTPVGYGGLVGTTPVQVGPGRF